MEPFFIINNLIGFKKIDDFNRKFRNFCSGIGCWDLLSIYVLRDFRENNNSFIIHRILKSIQILSSLMTPSWDFECLNKKLVFSNFSCMFLNPNIFSNLDYNCSNLLDLRNLQEQVKKAFFYQKLFWPFTVWINCSFDLKTFLDH